MTSNERVLLVDDNPINLEIIEEALCDRYELAFAKSGTEAMHVAPRFRPGVVLLDVKIPKPDGYAVCGWIRQSETLLDATVLMVSALASTEERLRAYRAGADDYIVKPFDEAELCAKVDAAFTGRRRKEFAQRKLHDVWGVFGETLELLSHLRDSETGAHIERMRVYSTLLAMELKRQGRHAEIDDLLIEDLDRASALHDVGKIAVPDAVLLKEGPLNSEEWEQMRQHTIDGAQILSRLAERDSQETFLAMAATIARSHHKNFDGSGYPDGMRGSDIPLAARIVRVADVFDALTTERPYKRAFSVQEARDKIEKGKGSEFDPDIVRAFHQLYAEFSAIAGGGVGDDLRKNLLHFTS